MASMATTGEGSIFDPQPHYLRISPKDRRVTITIRIPGLGPIRISICLLAIMALFKGHSFFLL